MSAGISIASAETYVYALRYARAVKWFDSVESEGIYVLLKLRDRAGRCGVAEVPIRPSWSGTTARMLLTALDDLLLPAIRTIDIADPQAVRLALSRFPDNTLAKALVDNACWSLLAEAKGQAPWRQWGGRAEVEMSWCLTRQEPVQMAEEAVRMFDCHGFRTFKVKGGQGIATDLDALARIRKAVGPGVVLTVDANCAYPARDALAYARALADAGVSLLEDPCDMLPDRRFSELVETSPVPILVDTPCGSLRDAAAFLSMGAKAISVKAGRVGLTEARRMHELAVAHDASVVAGLYGESALGTLMTLQFAATIEKPAAAAEMSYFLMLADQVLSEASPAGALRILDGKLHVPERCGGEDLVDWQRLVGYQKTNA